MPLVGGGGGLGRGIDALVPDAGRDGAMAELVRRVEALERELERSKSRREYLSAEEMYLAARSFIECNSVVWGIIESHARAAAFDGRRFSMKREFEDMRDEYATVGDVRWRFRNPLAAPLVRFLLLDVPEADPFIKRGHSKVDKYFDGTCEPPSWPPEEGGVDAASQEG